VKANPLALTDLPYYPSLTMVSVTVYDGARTIGGNKILVEEGGRGVFWISARTSGNMPSILRSS
jgi:hypothetical protein